MSCDMHTIVPWKGGRRVLIIAHATHRQKNMLSMLVQVFLVVLHIFLSCKAEKPEAWQGIRPNAVSAIYLQQTMMGMLVEVSLLQESLQSQGRFVQGRYFAKLNVCPLYLTAL